MEKYKICPSCKTKNPPAMFECMNCEADITGVKITDEETEKMIAENAVTQAEVPKKMVRVCECGAKNPPNARKCSSCNEDISDIIPIPDIEEEKIEDISYVLSSLDGQFAYKVTTDDVTIGRENTMSEYLSAKSYVSRSHARVTKVNNEMFVENLSNTNFTYVNNKKITEKTKLQDGDEIGLGGTNINGKCQEQAAYFLVRIGQCM
jgi:ribosomal protein L40E